MIRRRPITRPVTLALVLQVLVLAAAAPARAGAWTLGGGHLWLEQSVSLWTASSKFASELDTQLDFADRGRVSRGDRIPFDPQTGGRLRVFAFTSQAWLGVLDGLDLGVTLPVLFNDFDTDGVDTVNSRAGLGDLRVSIKGGLRFGRWALALSSAVKLPTGDFDPSVFSAPLTEGQLDVAFAADAGLSLGAFGYANAQLGYRLRFENGDNQRRPGDELFLSLEGGMHLPWGLMPKLKLDGLLGRHGEDASVPGRSFELPLRRLLSIWAGILWSATRALTVEVDVRVLLAGEDYPTGVQIFLAASYRFRLWNG